MSVLLIYECIPETKLYLLPNDVAEEYEEYLEAAQNQMLNCDETNTGMEIIANAVAEQTYCASDPDSPHACKFHRYLMNNGTPIEDNISKVYLTGIVM